MTLRMAEKIMGGAAIFRGADSFYHATTPIGQFDVRASNDKDAAQRLVDMHWKDVCLAVFRKQRFLCAYCFQIRPLQGHHKKFRSHGRVDSVEGTDGICQPCHDAKYGPHGRRS